MFFSSVPLFRAPNLVLALGLLIGSIANATTSLFPLKSLQHGSAACQDVVDAGSSQSSQVVSTSIDVTKILKDQPKHILDVLVDTFLNYSRDALIRISKNAEEGFPDWADGRLAGFSTRRRGYESHGAGLLEFESKPGKWVEKIVPDTEYLAFFSALIKDPASAKFLELLINPITAEFYKKYGVSDKQVADARSRAKLPYISRHLKPDEYKFEEKHRPILTTIVENLEILKIVLRHYAFDRPLNQDHFQPFDYFYTGILLHRLKSLLQDGVPIDFDSTLLEGILLYPTGRWKPLVEFILDNSQVVSDKALHYMYRIMVSSSKDHRLEERDFALEMMDVLTHALKKVSSSQRAALLEKVEAHVQAYNPDSEFAKADRSIPEEKRTITLLQQLRDKIAASQK